MTWVFKIQEYEFIRNTMDSRLRGNDKRTHEEVDTGLRGNDGVKKSPERGNFYYSDLISARTAVKARARSSIRPFRFALVNSAV